MDDLFKQLGEIFNPQKQVKSTKDLIYRDVSRCNDYQCQTRGFCARFRQIAIDRQKGENLVSVSDFNGREKVGLCDYFINADVD